MEIDRTMHELYAELLKFFCAFVRRVTRQGAYFVGRGRPILWRQQVLDYWKPLRACCPNYGDYLRHVWVLGNAIRCCKRSMRGGDEA